MTTYLKLDVEASAGLPAVSAGRSASENLRSIIRFLKGFPEARQGTLLASAPGAKASGTLTCASVATGNTAVVNGVTMTAAQKHSTRTVTLTTIAPDATVTLAGVVFTAKASAPGANEFLQSGDDAADGAALTAAINASVSPEIANMGVKVTTNPSDGDTVTFNGKVFTFKDAASAQNEVTIGTDAAATAANLAAAINAYCHPTVACSAVDADDTVTVDGVTFTAKAAPDTSGYQFLVNNSDNAKQAQILAAAIQAKMGHLAVSVHGSNVLIKRRGSTAPLVVVGSDGDLAVTGVGPTITARNSGAYVIFSTPNDLEPSFAGEANPPVKITATGFTSYAGATADIVTVRARLAGTGGSVALSASTESVASVTAGAANADAAFCFTGSDTQVARDLVRALSFSTNALVLKQIDETSALGVVTVTAKHAGVLGNAITLAGTGNVTASAARLTGGTETDVVTMAF